MRFLIAGFSHETNTFSPVQTPLGRFCPDGKTLFGGKLALNRFRGTETSIGGFIAAAEAEGADIEIPVTAFAPPSAPVSRDAYETIANIILDALKASSFDGVMLNLHGAMVADGIDDGEGEFLRRIRQLRPNMPIAVALDMHANISSEMVKLATVITGYHLYPHLDMGATGRRAGEILMAVIANRITPAVAWGRVPMLAHTMRQSTDEAPNRDLQAKAAAFETEGRALAASVFTGFNLADVPDACLSAVVITDGDETAAQAIVDELLEMAWSARADFRFVSEPLADSVARARGMANEEGPVFLLDHCDNAASGGTMDTTAVLAEIIAQGLEDVAFFGIFDPAAVEAAIAAGVGATVDLEIGGKFALPSLRTGNPMMRLKGTVKTLSDGVVPSRSKASFGISMSMGRAAVIDTGRVEVVLVSQHIEPFSIDILTTVGIDPRRRKFIALKSRHHWRAELGLLAQGEVACAGLGVCTSDYSQLRFENVKRPIYPLDEEATWSRESG